MAAAVDIDVGLDDENNVVSVDTYRMIRSLTLLAKSDDSDATNWIAIKGILSSINCSEDTEEIVARKRHLKATVVNKYNARANKRVDKYCRATDRISKTRIDKQCKDCDRVFTSKLDLDRHINNEQSVKRGKLVQPGVLECRHCEKTFAFETTLRNHEMSHAACSNSTNTKTYKCRFCDKRRIDIYNHYVGIHIIENPERILFYDGDALVHSSVDTKGGEAPWFVKERENANKRHRNVTCRLCLSEKRFDDTEILEAHYTLYHKVDPENPEALDALNSLFRARKGAYLEVSTPRHNSTLTAASSTLMKHIPSPRVKKTETESNRPSCILCKRTFSNKYNLKKHVLTLHEAKPLNNRVVDSNTPLKKRKNDKDSFKATKGAVTDLLTSKTPSKRKNREQSSKNNAADNKTEIKSKACSGAEHKKIIDRVENTDVNAMILYQCEECEVATTSYDASVEHAQLHYLEGYQPITETCHICKWTFEPQCFADHSNHGHDIERKIQTYNPYDLLNDDWFTIFQGLPETLANLIKSSSVYQHTRAVKINSDEVSGFPIYQCTICELYVNPKDIEEHCNNKNACIQNKGSKDNFCPECDIYFYTFEAITEHYKEHTENRLGISSFRKATFNCRQDTTINKVLQELKSKSLVPEQTISRDKDILHEDNPVRTQPSNSQTIEIVDDKVVSVFCEHCMKYILYPEFEAHAATHEDNQSVTDGSDLTREEDEDENCLKHAKESVNTRDVASQGKGAMATGSNEDTVEIWSSDDSCHSLVCSTYEVQAQVHEQKKEEVFQNNHKKLANRNKYEDALKSNDNHNLEGSAFCDDNDTNDCFGEELAKDLRLDLQNFNEILTEQK